MARETWIRNSLSVARCGVSDLYVLATLYAETDPLNAAGQVLRFRAEDGMTHSVLSTPSPLAAMWQSPSGHLWLGSADGSAWTTAPVPWRGTAPAFRVEHGGPAWSAVQLPALEDGLRPNVTAVWGRSDADVFFATATGAVYRWNGRDWQRTPGAVPQSLTRLHGTGATDVYAAGYAGTLAHWDGQSWTLLGVPDIAAPSTIVTGVAALANGEVHAATNRGELMKRVGPAFRVAERAAGVRFTGMVPWQDGVALSSATGAWAYDGRTLQHVMGKFSATDVVAVGDRLYFIETEQPLGPCCLEYWPRHPSGSPWHRIVF